MRRKGLQVEDLKVLDFKAYKEEQYDQLAKMIRNIWIWMRYTGFWKKEYKGYENGTGTDSAGRDRAQKF